MSNARILAPAVWLRSLPIVCLVLAIFFYWFAIADRYAVFLYEHLGAAPFDPVTRSRYWMAGLVADGIVLCVGVLSEGIGVAWARRRGRVYPTAPWWAIWIGCSLPLAMGIPLIVITVNEPTLPPLLAVACVATTLAGLALALMSLSLVATDPGEWIWSAADGIGALPLLLTGVAVELPAQGLIRWPQALAFVAAVVVATVVARFIVERLRLHRRRALADLRTVMVAGFCWAYLVLPLLHYLLATPPDYRYITAAANFFADSPLLQVAIWLAVIAITAGVRSLFTVRRSLVRRVY